MLRTLSVLLLLLGCTGFPSHGQSPARDSGQPETIADVFARVHSSVVTLVTNSRDVDRSGKKGLTSISSSGET